MKFSKSHIDRLFKGQALPAPPWPFTRQFLTITNRAAGLSAEQHQERLTEARQLVQSLGEKARTRQPEARSGRGSADQDGDTVAALRLEVDLERARHTETRLRYALRDAQFLMATLWSIISALRDIISSHDALYAGVHHGEADPRKLARIQDETQQALLHKQVAHEEADRTVGRVRSLETLWEQARTDVHRLSLHPDAHDLKFSAASDPGPPPLVVPHDLLAQPALNDIAAALGRARTLNSQEELTAAELEHALKPVGPLQGEDEMAILVAATRLPDGDNRLSALRTLRRGWPLHAETQQVLIRLANDEVTSVRGIAVDGLVEGWAGDAAVRDVLIDLLGAGEEFDVDAFDGLVQGWASEALVRDVLIHLVGDGADAYRVVVEGIVDGWTNDPLVHAFLIRLLGTGGKDVRHISAQALLSNYLDFSTISELLDDDDERVHHTATEALTKVWKGSAHTRDTLLSFLDDQDKIVGHIALQGLQQGKRAASGPLDVAIRFSRDDDESARRAAARVLTQGWPGNSVARDAVATLLRDENQRIVHAAARQLAQGWPGDPVARNALASLKQHGSGRAQHVAGRLLEMYWSGPEPSI
ncbi:HEAT repeat domain-containing protein [Streptomyces microflavus]|uniref:HEAT repeat domain-containing protein n=1 Tax=Streptomyces microflavus TaxID=1919 RepID=UPI0033E41B6E